MEIENRIPLYVLNKYLKFEKKLYHIYKFSLGRPIPIKIFVYAISFFLILLFVRILPFVNILVTWIPKGVYFLLMPIGFAWLLGDIGTEDRSPINFFKSFLGYHARKIVGNSYYRNRISFKPRTYRFNNYFSYDVSQDHVSAEMIGKEKEIINEQHKTLNYLKRIEEPDLFFQELNKSEKPPKKIFGLFNKRGD